VGENHNIMNLTKLTKSQIQKLIEDDPSGGVIQKIIEEGNLQEVINLIAPDCCPSMTPDAKFIKLIADRIAKL